MAWYTLFVLAKTYGMFTQYIGIDWSGASGPNLRKLQVAACELGKSLPQLVQPSESKYWRRDDLINWIIKKAKRSRILVGIDFGFAYPYLDKGAYFPGHPESPKLASDLWRKVDSICQDEPDFYAGRFYKDRAATFSPYLCYQSYTGVYFDNNRLRRTEQACNLIGTRPTCLFKCVGADQAGSGSAAGMRVLHFLTTNHSRTISVWPFYNISQGKSAMVEIYPRLFFTIAGKDSQQWNKLDIVNAVLQHFGSEPLMQDVVIRSEDTVDAIVSAAALRHVSRHSDVWHPQNMDEITRQYEGWIFGCT